VFHGGQLVERLATYPLGRRIRRDQLGVSGLEIDKLGIEAIVGRVRDLGALQDVVEMVMMTDLLAQ
jgi:hypothetical protein